MDNKQNDFGDLYNLVENGATQIILTGAPGTGKTRLAKRSCQKVCKKIIKSNINFFGVEINAAFVLQKK